jgi:AraC-like DNA-binding protein
MHYMKSLNIQRMYFDKARTACLGVKFLGCGREKGLMHRKQTVRRFGVALVTGGSARLTVGENVHHIKRGDLLMYLPRDVFSLDPDEGYEEIYMVYDGAIPRQYMANIPRYIPRKKAAAISTLMRKIWNLSCRKRPDFPAMALITWEILGQLALSHGTRLESPNTSDSDPIQEIMEIIKADPAEKWNYCELAERYGISYPLLRLRVKQKTGLPIGEFHNRERINKACVLLAKGVRVKQAALAVGITNQLYFSRFFKKRTSQTPSDYRQMYCKPERDHLNGE